jgi:hypothetical protein
MALPLFVLTARAGASVPHLVAPTSVTVVASPTAVVQTQPLQFTVTVAGTSGTPTGTIEVDTAGGSELCSAQLVGGTATCTTTQPAGLPSSSTGVIAGYSGDSTYTTASGTTTIDLSPAPTATTLTTAWSAQPSGPNLPALTATIAVVPPATSADVGLYGVVVFTDNGVPIPNCDGNDEPNSNGSVTCIETTVSAGSHSYQAEYEGDGRFTASSESGLVTSAVPANVTTVSGSSSTVSPVEGQKILLNSGVMVSPAIFAIAGQAQGEVTFSVGSLVLCTTPTFAGSASCYTSLEPPGSDTVTVSFVDPTGVFLPSSATFTLNVRGLTSAVDMASTSNGGGYWITDAQGDVQAFGSATNYGSMAGTTLNAPIAHIVSTPDGLGYWLVASDGGIFSFGDAPFLGSMGGKALNAPVVSMAPTADGNGYWLVAKDGGIFSFGDAQFYGSMGGTRLNKPVVGVVADKATGGYWEVASDGGIFSFNAPFYGSTGGIHLNEPVIGMASTSDGKGYLFVASDGGIFAYGDAGFYGSTGGMKLAAPIVGMAPDKATGGYWLVGSDGGIFSFNAPFYGSQ